MRDYRVVKSSVVSFCVNTYEIVCLASLAVTSEEERLLTEIDHIIGLLPFVINNLNPDLQTEINLAVQPLRVENSDLRR